MIARTKHVVKKLRLLSCDGDVIGEIDLSANVWSRKRIGKLVNASLIVIEKLKQTDGSPITVQLTDGFRSLIEGLVNRKIAEGDSMVFAPEILEIPEIMIYSGVR